MKQGSDICFLLDTACMYVCIAVTEIVPQLCPQLECHTTLCTRYVITKTHPFYANFMNAVLERIYAVETDT